ncbi:hypothetical protein [Acidihalobacter ferrooxydans]|uniref:hypothetical protein n=1 Tax=Acidihalobacter ferrooxydans TaxID=1765967 RepID=UPI0012EC5C89|nr:hypothetical protein [Acidihalobacter ferrooxydans]
MLTDLTGPLIPQKLFPLSVVIADTPHLRKSPLCNPCLRDISTQCEASGLLTLWVLIASLAKHHNFASVARARPENRLFDFLMAALTVIMNGFCAARIAACQRQKIRLAASINTSTRGRRFHPSHART